MKKKTQGRISHDTVPFKATENVIPESAEK
jgi:hypothetical protein